MLNIGKFPGLRWFYGAPPIVLLDQVTKWWVLKHLSLGEMLPVMPGLSLTLSYNRGVAFSMFGKQAAVGQILLIIFIILICAMVGIWLAKTKTDEKWSGISLLFIFGGAIGNLLDRLLHGHVIDFIDCYWRTTHFYTFNIADSFITIGALMMIKTIFTEEKKGLAP
jgi:signal peptidase II